MAKIYSLKHEGKTFILEHAAVCERADIAYRYLNSLPDRLLPYVFWDAPAAQIPELFPRILAQCEVFFAWEAENFLDLIAIAWFAPVQPGSACLNAHFNFKSLSVAVGKRLAWRIFDELVKDYSSLIALIPDPLFGANCFAAQIGLKKLASLPGVCNFLGRTRNAQLYMLDLRERGWPWYPHEGADGSPAILPDNILDEQPGKNTDRQADRQAQRRPYVRPEIQPARQADRQADRQQEVWLAGQPQFIAAKTDNRTA